MEIFNDKKVLSALTLLVILGMIILWLSKYDSPMVLVGYVCCGIGGLALGRLIGLK
jgi:hypothetical protein